MLTDIKSGIQLVIFLIFLAAIGYFLSQAIPAITQAATLPARVEAEAAKVQAQSKLDAAQLEAQARAVPTLQALDVQAKQAAIDNERAKAQAAAQAELIKAEAIAEHERTAANVPFVIAGAFVLAVLICAAGFVIINGMRARNAGQDLRTIVEIAARDGGRLELPNGHAVTFALPGERQARLTAGKVESVPQVERAPIEVERRGSA